MLVTGVMVSSVPKVITRTVIEKVIRLPTMKTEQLIKIEQEPIRTERRLVIRFL